MVEMRCARLVSAYSLTVEIGSACEVRARKNTGKSAGFTLRKEGGAGMEAGSWRAAEAIAEFTSCAAASMSRSRLNWIVMRVTP